MNDDGDNVMVMMKVHCVQLCDVMMTFFFSSPFHTNSDGGCWVWMVLFLTMNNYVLYDVL